MSCLSVNQVHFYSTSFDLRNICDRTIFFHEFYNFARYVNQDQTPRDACAKIAELEQKVKDEYQVTLRSAHRPKLLKDHNSEGGGNTDQIRVSEARRVMIDTLERSGYTVGTEDEFQPFDEVRPLKELYLISISGKNSFLII